MSKWAVLTVLGVATIPLSAQAQAPAGSSDRTAAAETENAPLQTVTVTARYQQENLQQTPIAITSVSSDQLRSSNITTIDTLGQIVPNMYTAPPDADEGGVPTISMRGVSQNDASFARAPAVAIYVDDIYHPTAVGTELDMMDIDRIQVLRGPQSTLSGNASPGGAIYLYTKQPTGAESGFLSFTAGSFNELGGEGAFDITLAPDLYLRVSGHYHRQDGYVDLLDFTCEMGALGTPSLAGSFPTSQPDVTAHHCKTGEEGGGEEAGAVAKLRWVASESLEVNLEAIDQRRNDQGDPELVVKVTNPYPNPSGLIQPYNEAILNQFGVMYDNRFLPPAGSPLSAYSSYCRPLLEGTVQEPPYQPVPSGICYPNEKNQDSKTFALKVDYQIAPQVHMTAIGSYQDYGDQYVQNGDESPLGYVLSNFTQDVIARTAEVRFTGKLFDNKLNWVLGGFWDSLDGQSNGFIGYITDNFNEFDKAYNESASGFFHVDYQLTSRWRFSGGARYTSGELTYQFNHPGLLVIPTPFTTSESRWDWLLSTDYQITDNTLAYFTVATGSRPPGITTIVITAQQMTTTPAESLTSYELGFKNEFFDHRLRANLTGFYSDYSSYSTTEQGVQCLGELPGATWYPSSSSCAALYPGNPASVPWFVTVGKPVKITGVEAELTAAPVPGLLFDFSGGYNHFESGVTTPGAPGYVHSGNYFQPAGNMHADLQYTINSDHGSFTPRLDWNWQSEVTFDPAPGVEAAQPQYIIPNYSIFNAQVEYAAPGGKWSAIFKVTNLTDKFYYYQLFNGAQINISSTVAPPREYHFTLRRDF
jgi:iron complex outermembrane receptor protein